MTYKIRLGIPEMLQLWNDLCVKKRAGILSKTEDMLYRKWGKSMRTVSLNPMHPGLHTHEIPPLSKRYGMKVWQSYLENRNSNAMRMYWVYGPNPKEITIIGLEPHPEDKKNRAYDKVRLSHM